MDDHLRDHQRPTTSHPLDRAGTALDGAPDTGPQRCAGCARRHDPDADTGRHAARHWIIIRGTGPHAGRLLCRTCQDRAARGALDLDQLDGPATSSAGSATVADLAPCSCGQPARGPAERATAAGSLSALGGTVLVPAHLCRQCADHCTIREHVTVLTAAALTLSIATGSTGAQA